MQVAEQSEAQSIPDKQCFVATIPVRFSSTVERSVLQRLREAQRLSNEVLAEYLRRAERYRRDPDFRRFRAAKILLADGPCKNKECKKQNLRKSECPHAGDALTKKVCDHFLGANIKAALKEPCEHEKCKNLGLLREKCEHRKKPLCASKQCLHKCSLGKCKHTKHRVAAFAPAPKGGHKLQIDSSAELTKRWGELRQRHGLIGAKPKGSLSSEGLDWYVKDSAWRRDLTARHRDIGEIGLGSDIISHEIIPSARDRVENWLYGKTGRPCFASRRHPRTSIDGSSSSKNEGSLRVNLDEQAITWKAAGGDHSLIGRLIIDESDAWLRKALKRKILVVRLLHRTEHRKRRWYCQLTLQGLSPLNPKLHAKKQEGVLGVDLGTKHLAAVALREGKVDDAFIVHLAPTAAKRERKRDASIDDAQPGDRRKRDKYIRRMQARASRKIERLPANKDKRKYKEKVLVRTRKSKNGEQDAAVGKTILVPSGWIKGVRIAQSKSVRRIYERTAEIQRADASARNTDHGRLVNRLLTSAAVVRLEQLSYRRWQEHLGCSLRRSAVGMFVQRLKQRAPIVGTSVEELDPASRLSQVCHACGGLSPYKHELSKPIAERMSHCTHCNRQDVHLDFYASFLACFVQAGGMSFDSKAAQAAWSGGVSLLVSARTTYERAVRKAQAMRHAKALRPSGTSSARNRTQPPNQRLRSVSRDGQRGEGFERPSDGSPSQGRSNQVQRASPGDPGKRKRVEDQGRGHPLDS